MVTYAINCVFNFQILGFATGVYNCTCSICGIKFIGGDRAVQCLECAIKLVEEKFTSTNKQMEFLCPVLGCNSKDIWNLVGTKKMKCGNCGYKWEAETIPFVDRWLK